MKTTIALLALLIIVASPALALDSPRLDIALLTYTPVPAEPGSYVTVTIQTTNEGTASTSNAAIELVDNYPFTVVNTNSKNIGRLDAQDSYLSEFDIRIDSAAQSQTYNLKVRYTSDQITWFEKNIPLTVTSTQKTISITDVTFKPETISAGQKSTLELKVKNLAPSTVRDVSVSLTLVQSIGTQVIDIPLAVIGSSTEKRIALLGSGQSSTFDFELQSYPSAPAGIYKIPVTLTFTDNEGNEYVQTDLVSALITSDTDLLAQVESTTVYAKNGPGDVIISITNRGLDEIKFLTVELADTDEYDIRSASNQMYLGNVDSDDYETAEFSLQTTTEASTINLPVTLTYKDALNNPHTQKANLAIQVITTKQAGQKSSSAGYIIAGIVVVAIILFIVMRRRKK